MIREDKVKEKNINLDDARESREEKLPVKMVLLSFNPSSNGLDNTTPILLQENLYLSQKC